MIDFFIFSGLNILSGILLATLGIILMLKLPLLNEWLWVSAVALIFVVGGQRIALGIYQIGKLGVGFQGTALGITLNVLIVSFAISAIVLLLRRKKG